MLAGLNKYWALGAAVMLPLAILGACKHQNGESVSLQRLSDTIYQIVKANRHVYARHIVQRLHMNDQTVKFAEQWQELKALPVPSQMLRMGAAEVNTSSGGDVQYSLKSLWAINRSHFPAENQEREGLIHILKNPGKNFYSEIEESGQRYFLAIYPDIAVEQSCVECHNSHPNSPKKDFQKGDLMGGLIVRVRLPQK
ncbi:MAG: DUF3365 domain-containing protein [Gammaproteobacteria bacterium]|nr:DUF3365 domain-containing protein [Gammaproteobacteria bacterium]MDH5799931.1 DUF3365 domain-containing protein [Gammaproteobacteria bacterium]